MAALYTQQSKIKSDRNNLAQQALVSFIFGLFFLTPIILSVALPIFFSADFFNSWVFKVESMPVRPIFDQSFRALFIELVTFAHGVFNMNPASKAALLFIGLFLCLYGWRCYKLDKQIKNQSASVHDQKLSTRDKLMILSFAILAILIIAIAEVFTYYLFYKF